MVSLTNLCLIYSKMIRTMCLILIAKTEDEMSGIKCVHLSVYYQLSPLQNTLFGMAAFYSIANEEKNYLQIIHASTSTNNTRKKSYVKNSERTKFASSAS